MKHYCLCVVRRILNTKIHFGKNPNSYHSCIIWNDYILVSLSAALIIIIETLSISWSHPGLPDHIVTWSLLTQATKNINKGDFWASGIRKHQFPMWLCSKKEKKKGNLKFREKLNCVWSFCAYLRINIIGCLLTNNHNAIELITWNHHY